MAPPSKDGHGNKRIFDSAKRKLARAEELLACRKKQTSAAMEAEAEQGAYVEDLRLAVETARKDYQYQQSLSA